jgi:hypothetical protein
MIAFTGRESVKRLLIGSLWAIWAVLFVLLLLLLFVPSAVAATPGRLDSPDGLLIAGR